VPAPSAAATTTQQVLFLADGSETTHIAVTTKIKQAALNGRLQSSISEGSHMKHKCDKLLYVYTLNTVTSSLFPNQWPWGHVSRHQYTVQYDKSKATRKSSRLRRSKSMAGKCVVLRQKEAGIAPSEAEIPSEAVIKKRCDEKDKRRQLQCGIAALVAQWKSATLVMSRSRDRNTAGALLLVFLDVSAWGRGALD